MALVRKIMEKLGKVKKGIEAMIRRVVESLRVQCQVCGAVMEMEGASCPDNFFLGVIDLFLL